MAKLTASQIANKIEKSVYTIKRWYTWYEQLTPDELSGYIKEGMPELPKYETVGATQWRYWDEKDIEQIKKFSNWMPTTRNGVIGNYKNKQNKGE